MLTILPDKWKIRKIIVLFHLYHKFLNNTINIIVRCATFQNIGLHVDQHSIIYNNIRYYAFYYPLTIRYIFSLDFTFLFDLYCTALESTAVE